MVSKLFIRYLVVSVYLWTQLNSVAMADPSSLRCVDFFPSNANRDVLSINYPPVTSQFTIPPVGTDYLAFVREPNLGTSDNSDNKGSQPVTEKGIPTGKKDKKDKKDTEKQCKGKNCIEEKVQEGGSNIEEFIEEPNKRKANSSNELIPLKSHPKKPNVQTVLLKEEVIPSNIKSLRDRRVMIWLERLLKMSTETVYKTASGEKLFLGVQIGGATLLFEYLRDERVRIDQHGSMEPPTFPYSVKYILSGIRFVPANAAIAIDRPRERSYSFIVKNLLNVDGTRMKDATLSIQLHVDPVTGEYSVYKQKDSKKERKGKGKGKEKEENEEQEKKNELKEKEESIGQEKYYPDLEFPIIPVIEGPVLLRFLDRLQKTELLDRSIERPLIENGKLWWLSARGNWTHFVEAFKKRSANAILKQFFYGIIFVTFVGVLYFYYLKDSPAFQQWLGYDFKNAKPSQVTNYDYYRFSTLGAQIDEKWVLVNGLQEAKDSIVFSDPVRSDSSVDAFTIQFGKLSSKELVEKGKVATYAFNDSFSLIEKIKDKDPIKKRIIKGQDDFFLVGVFKKTEKIILSYVYYEEGNVKPFWISYMTISRKKDPGFYDKLLELIKIKAKMPEKETGEIAADGAQAVENGAEGSVSGAVTPMVSPMLELIKGILDQIKGAATNESEEGVEKRTAEDAP